MGFLDTLIYGVRYVYALGVQLTERDSINFGAGLVAVDNPTTKRTDVTATAGTTPTGDGFRIVAGGVEAAAAVLIDLAQPLHIDAATVLPVANGGTNLIAIGAALEGLRVNGAGTALEYAAIVPTAPGATANEVQSTDGAGAFQAVPNVRAVSAALEVGAATVAAAGLLRLPTTTTGVAFRDVANAADIVACETDASDNLWIGGDAAFARQAVQANRYTSFGWVDGVGSAVYVYGYSSAVRFGVPIIGYQTPYSVHAESTIDMADAAYAAVAADYESTIITNGAATAMTASRTLSLPNAGDGAAYSKFIRNTNGGGFAVVVTDVAAGTTVTIADGFGAWVAIHGAGAIRLSADVAP